MMTLFVALLFASALFLSALTISMTVAPAMPKIRAALAGHGVAAMPLDPLPPRRMVVVTPLRSVQPNQGRYRVAA